MWDLTGVLIRGGPALEDLGRARAVLFDKTGTLTAGRCQVSPRPTRCPKDARYVAVGLAEAVAGTTVMWQCRRRWQANHQVDLLLATTLRAVLQGGAVSYSPNLRCRWCTWRRTRVSLCRMC